MELIFERPQPAMKLISLADLYLNDTPEPTLNLRLKLCSQIAVAVLQTHTLSLAHKHIRPENLLIALEKDDKGEVENASLFLMGWTNARLMEGIASKRIGESTVSKIIYQHPNRRVEGGFAKEDYNMGHDIYSLGVCMLELLTWDVLIRPGETKMAAHILSDAYQRAFEGLGYHKALNLLPNDDLDDDDDDEVSLAELYTQNSKEVQCTLMEMAKTLGAKKAGDRMANLVHRCLTCLDPPADGGRAFSASQDNNIIAENFHNEVFDDFNKLLAVI